MSNVLYGDSSDHVATADISSATVTFYKLGSDSQTTTYYQYTGFPIMPGPVVALGQTVLVPDVDYRLEFTDNVDLGTATCKVMGKGSYSGEATATFLITRTVEDATIVVSPLSYDYTGSPITPTSVTVTYYDGSNLVEGEDYTVSYSSPTNAGEGVVTITGIGKFTGTKTATYFVTRKDLSSATVTIQDSQYADYVVYTGAVYVPVPTVYMGQTLLVQGTDYDVSYRSNTYPGTAYVIVSGRGNYKGDKSVSFVIKGNLGSGAAKPNTVTTSWPVQNRSFTYTGTGIIPNVSVSFVGIDDPLTSADIDITFTNNVNAAVSSSASAPTMTVTAKAGSFYIGSFTETFTIIPRSVSGAIVEFAQTTYPYIGNALTPVPSVYIQVGDASLTLTHYTDFTITYLNNSPSNIGTNEITSSVTITGRGNFTGTVGSSFKIRSAKLYDAQVTLGQTSYTYDGTAKTPSVTSVTLYGSTLTEGTDYSVSYSENTNAGTNAAKVIISPASGLVRPGVDLGTKEVTFSISPRDISSAEMTIQGSDFTYTGEQIRPDVTVSDTGVSQTDLILGTDYTLSYSSNVSAGSEATAVATGKGNYTGTISKTFVISPRSLDTAVLSIPYEKYLYTGSAVRPDGLIVTLTTADGYVVIPETDFTVSYSNNTNVGTATITITGRNNCSGMATLDFPIVARDMANVVVSLENDVTSYVYNGTTVTPNFSVEAGSFTLVEGRDFTSSWSNNDRPGFGCLKLTAITSALSEGHGNVTGFTFVYFQITKMPLAGRVTLVYDSTAKNGSVQAYSYQCSHGSLSGLSGASALCQEGYVYTLTGTEAKPSVSTVLKDPSGDPISNNGATFTEGVDYDVSYEDNDEAGIGKVVITARDVPGDPNRYSGSATFTFIIRNEFSELCSSPIPPIPYSASRPSLYDALKNARYSHNGAVVTPGSTSDENTFLLVSPTEQVSSSVQGYTMAYGKDMYSVPGNDVGTYSVVLTPHMAVDALYRDTENVDHEYRGLALFLPQTIGNGTSFNSVSGFTGWNFNKTFAGQKTIQVTISPVRITSLTQSSDSQLLNGSPFILETYGSQVRPSVAFYGAKQSDYGYTYGNNTRPGRAFVTLSASSSGNLTGSRTESFTIYLSDRIVSIGVTEQSFTGSAIKPPPSIDFDDETISEGTDYTVTYGGNHDVGTGTVSVGGRLFYTSAVKEFVISRGMLGSPERYVVHSMDANGNQVDTAVVGDNPHVGVSIESLCYVADGTTEHEPDVVVTYDGVPLERWTDYYLYYSNTKEPGLGYVVIVGMGGFDGEIKKTVRILPQDFSDTDLSGHYQSDTDHPYLSVSGVTDKTYAGSPVTQSPVVRFAGRTLTQGTDYTVSYSGNTQITSAGSYAVMTITGAGSYTGSVTRQFRIFGDISTGAAVTLSSGSSVSYTGYHIEPTVTVVFGGTTLTSGTDYTVGYSSNRYPGKANVTVTGIGKYVGAKTVQFDIVASLTDTRPDGTPYLTAVRQSDVEVGKGTQNPVLPVFFDDKQLESGVDYSITYSTLNNASEVTATITGVGNFYSGSVTVPAFTRACYTTTTVGSPPTLRLVAVVGDAEYTGSPVTPTVEVYDDGLTVNPSFYEVTYSNNVNVGRGYAMIVFKSPYGGSVVKEFRIS